MTTRVGVDCDFRSINQFWPVLSFGGEGEGVGSVLV